MSVHILSDIHINKNKRKKEHTFNVGTIGRSNYPTEHSSFSIALHSKCAECKFDCQFKGKYSYPKIEDLDKVPKECAYLMEFQKTLKQIKTIAESYAYFPSMPIQSYRNLLEACKNISKIMSMTTTLYFPSREFLVLEEHITVPKKSIAMKFIERLNECPKGKEGWSEFQGLCKEILEYLFVPPLIGPFEQSYTETGLHIRDFRYSLFFISELLELY